MKTKRNRIGGVVGFGPTTPDKQERHFYDFFLVEKLGFLRSRKCKVPAERGQLIRRAGLRAEELMSQHPVEAEHLATYFPVR